MLPILEVLLLQAAAVAATTRETIALVLGLLGIFALVAIMLGCIAWRTNRRRRSDLPPQL